MAAEWIKDCKRMAARDHRGLHHRSAKSLWTRCSCSRTSLKRFTCLTFLNIMFHQWFMSAANQSVTRDEKKIKSPRVKTGTRPVCQAVCFHIAFAERHCKDQDMFHANKKAGWLAICNMIAAACPWMKATLERSLHKLIP